MNRGKHLIWVFCLVVSVMCTGVILAGEPMKNKTGEILKARAVDLAGNPTLITLERAQPEKSYQLALLTPPLFDPYWVGVVYGVVDEAEKLGLPKPMIMSTETYQRLDQQASQVEDSLARGAEAILIAPLSYEGSAEMVARAAEMVPMISVAQQVKTDRVSCTVETDNEEGGILSAEFMVKASGGEAKIALLKGPPGASWSQMRVNALKDIFAKHPGMEVAAEQWHSMERAVCLKIVEDWLLKVPDLDWVWDVGGSQGSILAIDAAGKTGEVKVATLSFSIPEDYENMKAGKIHLGISDHQALMGRIAVHEAIRALQDERTVEHIYVPKGVFTPENVDAVDETLIWAPEGFQPK